MHHFNLQKEYRRCTMTKPAPTPATEAGYALIDADDYAEQVQALPSERAGLLALPSEPSQVVERPGRTATRAAFASLRERIGHVGGKPVTFGLTRHW